MTEPVWLLKPVILAVHDLLIARFGGSEGLRDEALLESALARPLNLFHLEECNVLPRLAAAYAVGILRNHPFIDGNKRTGFMAAYMFLDLNGMTLKADEASAAAMTLALASSSIEETDYARWLAHHTGD